MDARARYDEIAESLSALPDVVLVLGRWVVVPAAFADRWVALADQALS